MKTKISFYSEVFLIALFAFIFIYGGSRSFGYEWFKTFGGSGTSEGGHSVQQTTDGGYIIVGKTNNPGSGSFAYLIKTDADGNELWSQFFDGYFGLNSLWQTTDGGYIAVGEILIKNDADGNELWRNENIKGNCVQQTSDGGYIIAATYYVAGCLIKTDADGNEQWRKTFGECDNDPESSVQQTTDGGYIISGYTKSYGAGEMSDVYLIYYKPDDKKLLYTPVTPCRIVDTREAGGVIDANTQRDFYAYGSGGTISAQGGNAAGCPAPSGEPVAALINLVVANPTGEGNMRAFTVGGTPGANLAANFADIGSGRCQGSCRIFSSIF